MEAAVLLASVAGFLHAVGYAQYARKVLVNACRPNLASWLLWVALAMLNGVSYFAMSGDAVKSLISLVSTLGCITVFLLTLRHGRFSRLDIIDTFALVIGAGAILAWWKFGSATVANLLLQGCIIISIIPTYRSVWRNPRAEQPSPWMLWAVAAALYVVVVLLRWQDNPADLVYPVNSLLTAAGVLLLTFRTNHASPYR